MSFRRKFPVDSEKWEDILAVDWNIIEFSNSKNQPVRNFAFI